MGTTGRSNGGLLMGNMLTRRPNLLGAITFSITRTSRAATPPPRTTSSGPSWTRSITRSSGRPSAGADRMLVIEEPKRGLVSWASLPLDHEC